MSSKPNPRLEEPNPHRTHHSRDGNISESPNRVQQMENVGHTQEVEASPNNRATNNTKGIVALKLNKSNPLAQKELVTT